MRFCLDYRKQKNQNVESAIKMKPLTKRENQNVWLNAHSAITEVTDTKIFLIEDDDILQNFLDFH